MKKQTVPLPDPPAGLSTEAAELWRAMIGRCGSRGRQAMLAEALRARDRADQCRAAVDAEGTTSRTRTTGAVHINPLLKAEREFRAQFLSAWSQLGLASQNTVFPGLDDLTEGGL